MNSSEAPSGVAITTCVSTQSSHPCTLDNAAASTGRVNKLLGCLVLFLSLSSAMADTLELSKTGVHLIKSYADKREVGGESNLGALYSAENAAAALEHAFDAYAEGNDVGAAYLLVDSMTLISDITYPENEASNELAKRWNAHNAPLGTYFHETRIANSGYWDTEWTPVSYCLWDGLGSEGVVPMPWSGSESMNLNKHFDFGYSETIQASWGVEVTKSWNQGGSLDCDLIPERQVSRVLASKRMAWHDQQRRRCVRRHYGKNGLKCDSWGENIHGDMPTKQSFNLECRLGQNDTQCH